MEYKIYKITKYEDNILIYHNSNKTILLQKDDLYYLFAVLNKDTLNDEILYSKYINKKITINTNINENRYLTFSIDNIQLICKFLITLKDINNLNL